MVKGNSSHDIDRAGRQPGLAETCPAHVVITSLSDADVQEAARLCYDVFLYDEPTTRRIAPDPARVFPESVWYVQSLVGRGLSFVAHNEQTHEIAGIVFSFDLTDDFSPEHERFTAFFDNFRPAIAMIDELEARYLDRSWCSPGFVLHAFQGGVRREYRRSGVLTALVDRMIAAARERGFHKIVADCTSPASQQALEKCGFRQVGFLGYDAFFIDGVRYFHGLSGGLSLMVKDL